MSPEPCWLLTNRYLENPRVGKPIVPSTSEMLDVVVLAPTVDLRPAYIKASASYVRVADQLSECLCNRALRAVGDETLRVICDTER